MFAMRPRNISSKRPSEEPVDGRNAGGDRQHAKEEKQLDKQKEIITSNLLRNVPEEMKPSALINPIFCAPKAHRRHHSKKKTAESTQKETIMNRTSHSLSSGTNKSSTASTLSGVRSWPERSEEPVQGTGDWLPSHHPPHYNIATIGKGRYEEDVCSTHDERSRRKNQEGKSLNWIRSELPAIDEDRQTEMSFTDKMKRLYPQAAGEERRSRGGDRKAELRSAFEIFDVEGLGCISAKRLRHILTSFGEILTKEEVDDIIHLVDVDGDGQIYSDQFVENLCVS
ncbi:hypothetical protein LAZ67_8000188 [Cordylochernes scorpioides]|uniref:EF-hand domain-containing protein n=1 Tax=Cordylochernes scorpioides TaxID=51811 RepID=A0ABY6KPS6_9ARAC|nr:hypothetical protein LAZ67_8000188 [Cordylochernes scorpioides]